jgi:hypothetical protein
MRLLKTAAVAMVALLALTACYDGPVIAKQKNRSGAGPHILIDDGDRQRWISVTDAQYQECSVGETWPECGGSYGGAAGNPDVDREPAEEREERQEEPKGECGGGERKRLVQLVATWIPDTFMVVEYALEDRNGRDSATITKFGGQWSRSKRLCPGGFAGIRVEVGKGSALPDELICFIRVDGAIVDREVLHPNSDPGSCRASHSV